MEKDHLRFIAPPISSFSYFHIIPFYFAVVKRVDPTSSIESYRYIKTDAVYGLLADGLVL